MNSNQKVDEFQSESSNKFCARRLEDKLVNHKIEFRWCFLSMDLSSIHHNREMPSGFAFYVCVMDATLPSKGTAHRANRTSEKAWPDI